MPAPRRVSRRRRAPEDKCTPSPSRAGMWKWGGKGGRRTEGTRSVFFLKKICRLSSSRSSSSRTREGRGVVCHERGFVRCWSQRVTESRQGLRSKKRGVVILRARGGVRAGAREEKRWGAEEEEEEEDDDDESRRRGKSAPFWPRYPLSSIRTHKYYETRTLDDPKHRSHAVSLLAFCPPRAREKKRDDSFTRPQEKPTQRAPSRGSPRVCRMASTGGGDAPGHGNKSTGGFRLRFYTEDDADVQRRRRQAAVLAARREGGADDNPPQPPPASSSSTSSSSRRGHRCDDRVEDLCRALAGGLGQVTDTVPPAWRLLRACLAAEPGLEPRGEYLFLAPGDVHWRDPREERSGEAQGGEGEDDDDPVRTVAAAAAVASGLAAATAGGGGRGSEAKAAGAGGREAGGWRPSWLGGGGGGGGGGNDGKAG
jgi:hypothetical protein